MTDYKQFIILVLLVTSFGMFTNAQSTVTNPYEESIHTYACNGISVGADYNFYINYGNNFDGGVLTGDFDFIGDISGVVGSDGIASTQIKWNIGSSVNQYDVWLEVTTSGCSNKIFIGVSPQPNNRTIEFDIMASTECFNPASNNFAVSFITLDNNRQPLSAAYFPMFVEFTVNGGSQSQLISFDNQTLQIRGAWFTADPTQNSNIIVEITNVTDIYNAPVKPGVDSGTHLRILFAIPEIEFTEELRRQYDLNEELTAYNISSTDHLLRMEPK